MLCAFSYLRSGLSNSPLFAGLLHFYYLKLHHLSLNSILHIACYIMLCEAFLGCMPHFGLWCKYFCVQPCTSGGALLDCGGTVICRVARAGYLDGSTEEINKNW